ncbi:MAG: Nif11-like leader peptide family natural product precursor [Microcystis aeruginosa Ma_AC_P_19900807_S299]|jgi:predicted ribosomally synthesized peptide with nif11-like leader|nr:MAG: Nif11-like leader peptide family natural product precursor [Microcystis aeruginosa Ma_AC_P_19900807_S299]
MSVEQTKAFYQRIATDEDFRSRFQNLKNCEEFSKLAKESDYEFTEREFETYTCQLLEAECLKDKVQDLNERELASILGGFLAKASIKPKYGSVSLL